MASKFSSGKKALFYCDRCGQRAKYREAKKLTIKLTQTNIKVCKSCWEPDQPQLKVGMYPVNDPQALKDPRPDNATESNRNLQWGWNPIGGARGIDAALTPNNLVAKTYLGAVTITT
jgi:hypothetical protein